LPLLLRPMITMCEPVDGGSSIFFTTLLLSIAATLMKQFAARSHSYSDIEKIHMNSRVGRRRLHRRDVRAWGTVC
jgi:hypothetical protein